MSTSDAPRLDSAELRQLLRAADPAALLVPPRLLRRVIKRDRQLARLRLQVPHHRSYVIGREALLALVDRAELDWEPDRALPPTLLLLARPEPEQLAALSRGLALVTYWRLLFHARVHVAVADRLAAQGRSTATIRQRIHHIGPTEFDEIRTVLRQEKYLLPPRDDRTTYEEFAALYLELSFFAAPLLPRYFPTIEDFDRIDRILAADVDAPALFAATRLAGAPHPVFAVDVPARAEEPGLEATGATTFLRVPVEEPYRDLMARADRAAATGNMVRAAIRRAQAARAASPELAGEVQARARAELDRLVERLQRALNLGDAEAGAWRQALPVLLPRAAHGIWPAEARLLFDLQKVCTDHERPIYAPDLVEWAYSHFRQPLVRLLPDQPLVLAVRHLRGAAGRLPSVRVVEAERHALSVLLHSALRRAEGRLRERFRPLLGDVLHGVGLRPQNFTEQVAHDKLVEELLDRVTERGFLNLGDLRDALARNQLKLPDLSGPGEFLGGDPLIRANRALAVRAPGVYHRGEIYLRWLQRGSALAFGTRLGRWFTLFFALPFGGAYATLVFVQEMIHLVQVYLLHQPHHPPRYPDVVGVGVLGVFYLVLLHVPAFRRLLAFSLRAAWVAARAVLIDLPAAVLRLPVVRRLLDSRPFQLFVRLVVQPLPVAAVVSAAVWGAGAGPGGAAAAGGVTQLAVSLLLNSRLGRDLEEIVTDWLVQRWEELRGLLPGVFRLVRDTFKGLREAVDRCLYTVDEWLRFRGGQGRLMLAAKTALGGLWFLVTYVVRLYVNVFIEPAVNPIKHFPAVTVAAKLLVPFWIPLMEVFAVPLLFLGRPLAYALAFLQVHALPGAGGFLVWELKENWRLYRANLARTLRPAVIGPHGETLPRLLRPGFHSGTLPRLYARLRRAERKAHHSGEWRAARRLREVLHHVEEGVRRFVERDLLAFLNGSKGWTAGPVHLAAVEAGSNRIRLELACPALGEHPLELKFEELSGWLLAGVSRPGWLPRLSAGQAALLATALIGFYQESGVDLVREQIEASFAPECPPYDLTGEGLVVWPGGGYETKVVYDLRAGPVLHPRVVEGRPAAELPVLEADQLLLSSRAVAWQDWVAAWERAQAGAGSAETLLPGVRVLPPMANAPEGPCRTVPEAEQP
jgi:hypothetical protein